MGNCKLKLWSENWYDSIFFSSFQFYANKIDQKNCLFSKQSTKDTSSLWGKIDFETPIIKPDGPSSADKPVQFDQKLNLTILPPAPALLVKFTQIPTEVLAGEIIPINVFLTNAGAEPLHDIWVVSDEPRWILGESDSQELPLSLLRG